MPSKMADITKQLKEAAGHKPTPEPKAVAAAPAGKSPIAPSRIGKKHIGVYLAPGYHTSLRLLNVRTGRSAHDLVAEALDELFRKHKMPVVGE
jgi:hypothetical protein